MAKKAILKLKNRIEIDEISEYKKKFDQALSKSASITIQSEDIERVDLTGIQLLHYFKTQSDIAGKELKFNLRIMEDPLALMIKSGFNKLTDIAFADEK